MRHKIISQEILAEKIQSIREKGHKIVHCHGEFDTLHHNTVLDLRKAKQEGHYLIVTIGPVCAADRRTPSADCPMELRAESLADLSCIDWITLYDDSHAIQVIEKIRPDFYLQTSMTHASTPQKNHKELAQIRRTVESLGGEFLIPTERHYQTASQENDPSLNFSPEVRKYLNRFKQRHSTQDVIALTHTLKGMNVLVVGEAIVDEYCYTSPLGMTGKSGNIITCHYQSNEYFAGGSLAVANHLAPFAGQVTLLAGLGREDRHEPFIRSKLQANVRPQFYYFDQGNTLVKRRYIDPNMNKLFEVYCYDNNPVTPALDETIGRWITENAPQFDVVIVSDYGNGFISPKMVDRLSESARFLAVNTQINSGNRGHHVITRYPRVDFVSLNEQEVRLAAHSRYDPIKMVAASISATVQARYFAITRGEYGSLLLCQEEDTALEIPAFSTHIIDRIGAGDAFLSLTGLGLGGGLSPEVALFLGSAAAALNIAIVCNRETIHSDPLFQYIQLLLR